MWQADGQVLHSLPVAGLQERHGKPQASMPHTGSDAAGKEDESMSAIGLNDIIITEGIDDYSRGERLKPSFTPRLTARQRRRLQKKLHAANAGAEMMVFYVKGKPYVVNQVRGSLRAHRLINETLDTPRKQFAAEAARTIVLQKRAGKLVLPTHVLRRHGLLVQRRVPVHSQRAYDKSTTKGYGDEWLNQQLAKRGLYGWDVGDIHNVTYSRAGVPRVYDIGAIDWAGDPTEQEKAEARRIYRRLMKA
jgi:hypothetical protein